MRGAMSEHIDERFDETTEVLIVGGGPGGSTTAARLAQRGRKPVLLERARFPRFHIGESLLPSSYPVLDALGLVPALDDKFVRKYSARFLDDEGDLEAASSKARYQFDEAFPPALPHAWEVSRDEFDELLLRNAARLGADVREGWKVSRVLFRDETAIGVEATDAAGEACRIGARVVVDATGRDGLLSRRVAPAGAERLPLLDKTAIFTHVRGGHRNTGIDAGQIEIVILAGKNDDGTTTGWAWFIPFKDGRSSVGFVLSSDVVKKRLDDLRRPLGEGQGPSPREYDERSADLQGRLRAVFAKEVARSPWMTRLIGDAPYLSDVRAAADYSFRVPTLTGDGWLAVGDSAGFLDPLFSTGAHLAIGGGDRAAAVIDDALNASDVRKERFEPYATSIRAAGDLFLGAVQSFYRGELRALLFAKEQRTALRRTITSMLAGDVFHDGPAPALWAGYFRERFPASL
jgi:flavin-dependent dehydrogenase